MPHNHVAVHGGVVGQQAQIDDFLAVDRAGVGAIHSAQHVAVFAHQRAVVGLAEFDGNVRLDRPQALHDVGEETIHGLVNRGVIAAVLCGENGVALRREQFDEIQLETVHAPFAHGGFIEPDEILANFRIAGIEDMCAEAGAEAQRFSLEALRGLGVLAGQRHRIP